MSTAIKESTEREDIKEIDDDIFRDLDEESTKNMETVDWMARMKSEMERDMNRMLTGADLILMVQRMKVFWTKMTSARSTDMLHTVVSITREG